MASIIKYEDVEITRAERIVLEHVSFNLEEGEFAYLVGRVGSGKSSLMKTLYADVKIENGRHATVLGHDLLSLRRKQIPYLRREIGIVFQDFQLLTDRSASANLEFALRATGHTDRHENHERIEQVLEAVGMEDKGYKMPHELSGGEQQRIVIARALLNRPKLILADEPTGNLDPATGDEIARLLHQLSRRGQAILMATHNLRMVEDFPARVLRCHEKRLLST